MDLFRYLLFACLMGGISLTPNPQVASRSFHRWTRVLAHGPWPESYNFQLINHRDTLWVFHPNGNWFSPDGERWTKAPLPNAIGNGAFLDYVPLGQAVLGLGHFEGNSERYTLRPDVYRTTDMIHWTRIEGSNLPRRFFYQPVVFQNKIWIIGGENSQTQFADIWNSTDGVHWQQVKDQLPFGKRSRSQFVTLGNRLYLLNNDVWSSADGLNWRQETPSIVNGVTIFGYAAVVHDGQIWLLGCNRDGQFSSQVLVSADGRTWREHDAPWSPRGGIAACTRRGKIYMTGGKYGGFDPSHPNFIYSNDVWTLD